VNKNLTDSRRQRLIEILAKSREYIDDDEIRISLNEIDKFINDQKFGLIFEEHSEDVFEMMNEFIPVFEEDDARYIKSAESNHTSFILEGDNLHSLHLLQKTHKKSIDLIYIDPPYNTGAKDWKYNNHYVDKNNGYRHSKWLSMMSHRLKYAKRLLKKDGAMVCSIDENELATLLLLIDNVFGESYAVDIITVVHNPRGVQGDNFSYIHEYAIFVYKKSLKIIGAREIDLSLSNFRNWGTESSRYDAANCFYPVLVKDGEIIGFGDDKTSITDFHPKQTEYDFETKVYSVYPIDKSGVEKKWRFARQTVESIMDDLHVKNDSDGRFEILIGKTTGKYKTVWMDKKYDANEYGTKLINAMVPNNDFNFPKSIYTVYDCLYPIIKNKPNAIVLDFFAGSGTTGHAVLKLNKDEGGNRTFILCTNNDVGEKKEREFFKSFPNLKDDIDYKNSVEFLDFEDKYGIARSITYPRIKSAIKGYIHSKPTKDLLFEKNIAIKDIFDADSLTANALKINELIYSYSSMYSKITPKIDESKLKVWGITDKSESVVGLPMNLRYYKTKMIPIQDESNDLSFNLLAYIRELVQLKYGQNQLEEDFEIVLEENQFLNLMEKLDKLDKLETTRIFYSPYILVSSQDEYKLNNMGVELIKIPDEFFKSELQGVGEVW